MAKKKPTKKQTASKKAVPFETSLESLREILGDLEEGNLPLSDSLARYEAGVGHLRNCHDALNAAKTKIELLTGIDKNGKPITKPYEHSATVEEIDADDAEELNQELSEETEDDDWDGGLF